MIWHRRLIRLWLITCLPAALWLFYEAYEYQQEAITYAREAQLPSDQRFTFESANGMTTTVLGSQLNAANLSKVTTNLELRNKRALEAVALLCLPLAGWALIAASNFVWNGVGRKARR